MLKTTDRMEVRVSNEFISNIAIFDEESFPGHCQQYSERNGHDGGAPQCRHCGGTSQC